MKSNGLIYPEGSISKMLQKVAGENSGKPALTYMNKSYTYKEAWEKTERVASAFSALGVKSGDMVLVCLPNIPQAVYVLYGLNLIGAVGVFVSPLSGEEEFRIHLKKCSCRFAVVLDTVCSKFSRCVEDTKEFFTIVTSAADEAGEFTRFLYKIKGCFTNAKQNVIKWRKFLGFGSKNELKVSNTETDDTAVVLFSGGTTGNPKAVEITNGNLNALAVGTEAMCGRNVRDVKMLSVLPVFHGFGLGITIHTTLFFGGEVLLVPRFEKESTAKFILRNKPEYIACVPAMLRPLMNSSALKNADLSFLSGVFSGGDSLSEELRVEFDSFLKSHKAVVKIRQGYGATECVAAVTLMPDGMVRKESCGLPYPDTDVKITTPYTEAQAPTGEIGEICISGKTVMKAYLDDKEETSQVIKRHSDGKMWLHTGDLGYVDAEGFLYFKQRLKRMIVSNGFNIYPSYIEQIALKHSAVRECCVVGVPDSVKQQVAVCFVVPEKDSVDSEDIKSALFKIFEKELTKQALPKYLFLTESIPVTNMGKKDFRKLEKIAQEKIKTAD